MMMQISQLSRFSALPEQSRALPPPSIPSPHPVLSGEKGLDIILSLPAPSLSYVQSTRLRSNHEAIGSGTFIGTKRRRRLEDENRPDVETRTRLITSKHHRLSGVASPLPLLFHQTSSSRLEYADLQLGISSKPSTKKYWLRSLSLFRSERALQS